MVAQNLKRPNAQLLLTCYSFYFYTLDESQTPSPSFVKLGALYKKYVCITETTQFCVTAGSTLIKISVIKGARPILQEVMRLIFCYFK